MTKAPNSRNPRRQAEQRRSEESLSTGQTATRAAEVRLVADLALLDAESPAAIPDLIVSGHKTPE